ncbi:tetratricopeptide (TPR) repeat protein [Novosphingobium chloroacetimidivorans]|uniref:Tetratricopeptide (TPR) repeat protein n=1 Tax=Novosphingobium chloroacetimidivorans TaxID=1428314 RepID=A0A7W7KAB5_9SPHN|nr:sulfotransferase [Novosphingobium chloroacetimidivorans]MBB4858609.1 tetratricopeptide (TPR) repeat protein [Novosphingobium chloroacetimidivorans]
METVRSQMRAGHYRAARDALSMIEARCPTDTNALLAVAECWTHMGRHQAAERASRVAFTLAPRSVEAGYALASALVATGDIDEADKLYGAVIAAAPGDWDAWANRATLRTATADRNHVVAMRDALRGAQSHPQARVALGYALAKELEDLGEYSAAFAHLADAAAVRRSGMRYEVQADVATIDAITAAFSAERLATAPGAVSEPGPIFVVGLPRSGTTLVDRILASHPEVTSLGELQDFALALMQTNADATDKRSLIDRSAAMDHARLGEEYLRRLGELSDTGGFVIDKAPLNYLYIGLIALALPNARIVHVRRGAMDSCYAMFKTLFRMGYPFSYSQDDLASYRLAYARLMDDWRSALPGRMVEIDYEALVVDPEPETRRMIAELGLAWDDACLSPHHNSAPVATASAVQVRSPIHDRSVGLWRRYESELMPLADALRAGGLALETETRR